MPICSINKAGFVAGFWLSANRARWLKPSPANPQTSILTGFVQSSWELITDRVASGMLRGLARGFIHHARLTGFKLPNCRKHDQQAEIQQAPKKAAAKNATQQPRPPRIQIPRQSKAVGNPHPDEPITVTVHLNAPPRQWKAGKQ